VTAWGSDLLITGPRNLLQRARARAVLGRADALIADSDNLGAAARQLGAPAGRTHVIPWGVDRERFAPAASREPELIVSTRMHEPVYGMETVLAGVSRVLARRPAATLVIAGDGSQRAALERFAAAQLPADRVHFAGRLDPDAMAALLGRAAIVVSASWSDSTSVSLLEAMAAGAIPVVSGIEGNREWVEEGDGARLFAPGDADGLAAAVERALLDPAWCAAARVRNARVIAERGDARVNMARIEALFESLARGSAR
jgi:glycosyltransferase involved in cell wall biosynthesis